MIIGIDHIGYLTNDISATAEAYEKLGFSRGGIYNDDIQKTRICFLKSSVSDVKIELVEPYAENKTMLRMLKKTGVAPYHICYVCDNIDEAYREMIEMGGVPLFRPVEAVAFQNRKICYFFSSETGFIELLNNK